MLALSFLVAALAVTFCQDDSVTDNEKPRLDIRQIRAAGEVVGIPLTDAELELMLDDVVELLDGYETLWERSLDNAVPPALVFTPLLPGIEVLRLQSDCWQIKAH